METGLSAGIGLPLPSLDPDARITLFGEMAEHFRAKVRFPDEQYLRNTADSLFRPAKCRVSSLAGRAS